MADDRRKRQGMAQGAPTATDRSRRWVLKALAGAATGVTAARAQDTGTTDFEALFRSNTIAARPAAPKPRPRPQLPLRRIAVPDFSRIDPARSYLAGIRPWRDGGMRLAREAPVETGGVTRHVVHNYGHGGAGISLAFGAAETVRGHVERAIGVEPSGKDAVGIAVIGAGIIGLTSALALVERYPRATVTIYARDIVPKDTTSWLAGGQFAHASTLGEYHTGAQRALLDRHLDMTEKRIAALRRDGRAARYGIARRRAYSLNPESGHTIRLSMGRAVRRASAYDTWLIDPRRLLPALVADLRARGVRFVERTFVTERDMHELAESVIVNCTGFGARDLLHDKELEGRRGHLVVFENPRRLDYFLNSWCGDAAPRYLFARHDDIVIGGTTWHDFSHDAFDPAYPADVRAVERIVASARGLFESSRGCV